MVFTAIAALILLVWAGATQHGCTAGQRSGSAHGCVSSIWHSFWDHFFSGFGAEDALVTRDPGLLTLFANHNITDIAAFFNPSKVPSPNLFLLYGEELIIVIYIGWIAISLAIYSIHSLLAVKRDHAVDLDGDHLFLCRGTPSQCGGAIWRSIQKIPLPFLALYKAFHS